MIAEIIITALLMLLIGWIPVIGAIIAGFIGGYRVGGMVKGLIVGLIGCILGLVAAVMLLSIFNLSLFGPVGVIFSFIALVGLIKYSVISIIMASIGGLIGGWFKSRRTR